MRNTPFAGLFAGLASLSLLACGVPNGENTGGPAGEPPLAGATIGGPFTLVNSAGETVKYSDFDGKYRIVYFGYAYCPDVCPNDVGKLMLGYKAFAEAEPDMAEQIQPMFITIDPERDTEAVVGEFAAAFSPKLMGLTGTPEQVKAAADAFKVFYSKGAESEGGGYLMDHSNIAYLMDRDGTPLATLPVDLGPEDIAAEIAKWTS
ncbi:SCO family protein [Altererythrobacter sp. ZODW24]|uniref:SCO family protein n=1 Tax=Altererythrobacter sp. ZODW24 TaxID=2185142 RepID=UPI001F086D7C|nr:SCO family protein [Altererythrobacter sp. ZODW24]